MNQNNQGCVVLGAVTIRLAPFVRRRLQAIAVHPCIQARYMSIYVNPRKEMWVEYGAHMGGTHVLRVLGIVADEKAQVILCESIKSLTKNRAAYVAISHQPGVRQTYIQRLARRAKNGEIPMNPVPENLRVLDGELVFEHFDGTVIDRPLGPPKFRRTRGITIPGEVAGRLDYHR